MPYQVRKRGDKWVVQKVKPDGGVQQVGSHATEIGAKNQLTALRIQEGMDKKSG